MSTYNGEKYLAEQLESIMNQTGVDVNLLIRDDGSTDKTLEILKHFCSTYPQKILLSSGENIGVINSYYNLIETVQEDYDYFAFADQDDVWLIDRLQRAIGLLKLEEEKSPDIPLLYCSSTTMFDDKRILGIWPLIPKRELTVFNALAENVVVGCTVVINKHSKQLLVKLKPNTKDIIMHDWWMYICVSLFGKIIFDDFPTVLYRQHSSNLVGGDTGVRLLVKRMSRFILNAERKRSRQLKELVNVLCKNNMGTILSESISSLVDYEKKSFISRVMIAFNLPIYKQHSINTFFLRLSIVFKRY
ncbi:glycosyltransferase family 2 protein [Thermobacillus composti]|nr:glycosyltransferase family 2 protein [Thermobacillus composti]